MLDLCWGHLCGTTSLRRVTQAWWNHGRKSMVDSRGGGWMREWMTRVQTAGVRFKYLPNLIHLSSSHQAFPDEKCPKTKSETNFQNPFSRLFGFFWLGAPRFFHIWHESILSESEVQRGSAHSEGGTRSYRKDAAPEAFGGWENQPKSVGGKYIREMIRMPISRKESSQISVFFFWKSLSDWYSGWQDGLTLK